MNEQRLALALARFEGFRSNLPAIINEACVSEYHDILDAVSGATGETELAVFKIRDADLERKVVGGQSRGYSGRPGRKTYSQGRRCDINLFLRQVEALANYLDQRGYTGRGSGDQSATAPNIHLHGDSPRVNINSVDNSANALLRGARSASIRDDQDRLSKMTGKRVRIRPMVKRFKATGEELTPIDDIWMVQSSSRGNIQLVNSATSHIAAFGADHIRDVMTDPNGGSDGMLILNSQITLRGVSIYIEPLL
jgi:hypothetical protein